MVESEKNISSSESDSDDEPLIKIAKRSASQQSVTSQSSSPSKTSLTGNTSVDDNRSPTSSTSSKSKPLTAFAHFFNDTQQSIRKKNGAATFEEVSQVVLSMWESLEANAKLVYQKREEEDRIRFEQSVHSVVPTLLEQADTERVGAQEGLTGTATDPVAHSDGTIPPSKAESSSLVASNQASRSSSVLSTSTTTPVIVGTLPKQNKVITLGGSNKIVISNKPMSSTKPVPDLTATLMNAKGITVINKSTAATSAFSSAAENLNSPPKYIIASKEIWNRNGKDTIQTLQTLSAAENVTIQPTATERQTPSPTTSSNSSSTSENNSSGSAQSSQKPKSSTAQEAKAGRRSATPSPQPKICKNTGCEKQSIKHKKWDEDFCSSKCVVEHCHERFKAWVAARS